MSSVPLCTRRDRELWWALVREMRAAASFPRRSTAELKRLWKATAQAVFPDQAPERRDAFRKLRGFAEQWAAMDATARLENAAAVLTWCDRCAAQLGDPPPSGPAAPALPLPDGHQAEDVVPPYLRRADVYG